MAKLILLSGNQQKSCELDERLTTIGRSPASTIMIDDSACSRKHCMIKREFDTYTIIDLSSANGVHVNGEKVKEATLKADDKIKIGSASFIFQEMTDKSSKASSKAKSKSGNGAGKNGADVDVEMVRALVGMMTDGDLSELEVESNGTKVRLRRGGEVVEREVVAVPTMAAAAPVMHTGMAAPVGAAAVSASSASAGAAAPAAGPKPLAANEKRIVSPLVGTFYRASNPETPPFVQAGDRVTEDKVVCLVEAMKVFNEIKAEVNGVIEEVLIDNGEAVEFDQPLFRVRVG